MAELRQCLRLDLPDALASNAEGAPHLLERFRTTVDQPEAQLDHRLLALRQRVQHRLQLFLQQDETRGVHRHDGIGVLDEVAELRVLFLADGRVQRHRLLRHLLDLAHLVGADPHNLADLLGKRLATEVLQELALDAHKLVDRLNHVHRDADRAGLVGDRASDSLTDPPRGIGGELEPLGVVELFDCADETEVPFLDQVEEQHAAPYVALRDGYDEPKIGLDQLVPRELTVALDPAQPILELELRLRSVRLGDLVPADALDLAERRELVIADLPDVRRGQPEPLRIGLTFRDDLRLQLRAELPRLDPASQIHLLGAGQQRDPPDLLEVHPHRVTRRGLETVDLDADLCHRIRVVPREP